MEPAESDTSPSRRRFLAGLAGASLATGTTGTALAQDDEGGGNESDGGGNETDGGDGGGGGGTEEVIAGPDGDLVFEPEELAIEPGTTVLWTWDSDNHNVNPSEQPEEAEWEGYTDLENAGFEYEHTFEVEGEYHYVCDPHVGQGMEGDIIVDPDAAQQGGGGGPAQTVPDPAWTLIIATAVGMVSVLSLTYLFLQYGSSPARRG